uniref:Uncharacterized protein n=1 Tax=Anopheles arabiensis TaxID=7173 RepID=A0A182IH49_ANOAR
MAKCSVQLAHPENSPSLPERAQRWFGCTSFKCCDEPVRELLQCQLGAPALENQPKKGQRARTPRQNLHTLRQTARPSSRQNCCPVRVE